MQVDPAEITEYLSRLAATPQRLSDLSKGADHTQLHCRSAEEPWSANDILAHLRTCADVWGQSIQAMITQDHPTLRYVSPGGWIKKTNYPELVFQAPLAAFTRQRGELLDVLRALPNQDLARGASFTGTTSGREETVLRYARRIAQHEDAHCLQIAALLKMS
jgi:hypothetical protein